jgi:hypothetical protein
MLHIISITILRNGCNVNFLKMAKEISKVVKLQVKGGAAIHRHRLDLL